MSERPDVSGPPKTKRERFCASDTEDFDPVYEEALKELRDSQRIYQSILQEVKCWKIRDAVFSDDDLSRTKPGVWLNDEIINAFGAFCESRAGSENLKVFTSFFFDNKRHAAFVNKDSDRCRWFVRAIKSKEQFDRTRAIAFPINTSNVHWALLIIDVRQQRLIYLDPLTSSNTRRGDSVLIAMEGFLKSIYDSEGCSIDWERVTFVRNVKQTNDYDCGVYVCYYVKCLVDQVMDSLSDSHATVSETQFSNYIDPNEYRMFLRDTLLSNRQKIKQ